MILFVRMLIILILSIIVIEDFLHKAIFWFWSPLLIVLFVTELKIAYHQNLLLTGLTTIINICILSFNMLVVLLYFMIKRKRPVNFNDELLGWGDIVFLLSLTCYCSPLNYMFFYGFSICVITIIHRIRSSRNERFKPIRIAGPQAFILMICLAISWCCPQMDITKDNWLQHLIFQ